METSEAWAVNWQPMQILKGAGLRVISVPSPKQTSIGHAGVDGSGSMAIIPEPDRKSVV
jgi:hypothetical protein